MKKLLSLVMIFMLLTGYSIAQTAVPPLGDGTAGNPYQIATLGNLYWLRTQNFPDYSIQTADIDASPTATWNSDGEGGYYGWPTGYIFGSYDGQGFVIRNLYINRGSTNAVSLFGICAGSVSITNVGLIDANITGADNTAGLVSSGFNAITISKCFVDGQITGNINVAGLVANPYQGSTIEKSFTNATVTGSQYVGGIAGNSNTLNITDCFAVANVSGFYAGGIIGNAYRGTLTNCYSASVATGMYSGSILGYHGNSEGESVTTGVNCFWNSDSCSVASNQAPYPWAIFSATAMNTSQNETQSTFTSAGWDFTSIWTMGGLPQYSFPYLQGIPETENALPVEISGFYAEYIKGKVKISWITESEENNAYFLIYRNNDVIAMIDGAGTTTEPHEYSFIDTDIIPGMTYVYTLADISYANELVIHDDHAITLTIDENDVPDAFALEANYPNPFNPSTIIPYSISNKGKVSLCIYDISGKLIRTLINGYVPAGYHEILWDGKDNLGYDVNSGVYISRLNTENNSTQRKMLMIK